MNPPVFYDETEKIEIPFPHVTDQRVMEPLRSPATPKVWTYATQPLRTVQEPQKRQRRHKDAAFYTNLVLIIIIALLLVIIALVAFTR